MAEGHVALAERLRERFAGAEVSVTGSRAEVGIVFEADKWLDGCQVLRDEFGFEQLMDLCGVDTLGYGTDEWDTGASSHGYSRGVVGRGPGRFGFGQATTQQLPQPAGEGAVPVPEKRFAAVVQLLSVQHNLRLRVTAFAPNEDVPMLHSLTGIWPVANWFEREAFDLYGIVFQGHPDLRRILTDYGFVGHPFRKDFPLIGNVEVRYDPERKRVVYEPVTSVEPRVTVPKVIRDDARYATSVGEQGDYSPTPGIGPADAGAVK